MFLFDFFLGKDVALIITSLLKSVTFRYYFDMLINDGHIGLGVSTDASWEDST